MARLCRSCEAALLVHGWVEVTLDVAGAHPLRINLVLRVRAAGIRPRCHAGKAQYAHQPQTAPTIAFGADSNISHRKFLMNNKMMTENKNNNKRWALVTPWKIVVFLLLFSIAIPLIAAEIYFRLTSPYIIRKDTHGPTGKEVSGEYGYFMDMLSGRRLIPKPDEPEPNR